MNREDVIDLLSIAAAATRRSVGNTDVEIWHGILARDDVDHALQAIREHFAERPGVWLEPGHIHQRCRALANDELARTHPNHRPHPGDAKTLDDLPEYPPELTPNQRLTAYWWAIKNHSYPAQTDNWWTLLRAAENDRTRRNPNTGPLAHTCPWCHAQPGQRCTIANSTDTLTKTAYHPSRVEAAENNPHTTIPHPEQPQHPPQPAGKPYDTPRLIAARQALQTCRGETQCRPAIDEYEQALAEAKRRRRAQQPAAHANP